MKTFVLTKGEKIAYQDLLEERIGPFLARNLPYRYSNGKADHANGIWANDDYFESDADYEISIVKKRKPRPG